MERSNLGNGGSSSCSRRPTGIPPFHPDLPAPPPSPPVNLPPFLGHSRSLSQPAGFFSIDSLPTPISSASSSPVDSWTASRGTRSPPIPSSLPGPGPGPDPGFAANGLPPRTGHRRSLSEIPCGPSQMPVFIRPCSVSSKEFLGFSRQQQGQLVKQEMDWNGGVGNRRSEGDNVDDLIDSYMNLDGLGASDSAGMEDKHEEVDGSRLSGSKSVVADSSENETESSLNESGSSGTTLQQVSPGTLVEKKGNVKRSGTGDMYLNVVSSHHCRSLSMDGFMGNLSFADESAKLPVPPGLLQGQHSHNNLFEGISYPFSLEFGNGEFSGAELKKIMANAKLAEIALHDPKRAKRILANRQSAARSKERKVKYVSELEHKVQTLQTEATTLSAQLTLLQRDAAGLTSQNNELRFRLQAMEQQAQLRDALNEALNSEVQRLKLLNAELGQSHSSNNTNRTLNSTFFQLQQQQLWEKETQQEQSSIAVHLPVAEPGRAAAAAAAKSEGE